MAAQTKEQVEKLVSMAVPESWSVEVDTFVNDVPLGPPGRPAGRGRRATKGDGLGDRRGRRRGGRPGDGAGVLVPGRAPAGTIRPSRRSTPAGIASTPATSPTPRIGSASSSVATPRRPPASSSAGPRREDASHDRRPGRSIIPRARTGRGGGTGAESRPPRASRPRRSPGPRTRDAGEISPLRKAAIVLVSLEQSLASQLLSHLDRSAVEMVTWEIARLDRIDPDERTAVLDEFYGLGLRRLCFVFDDLVKMGDVGHPRGLP